MPFISVGVILLCARLLLVAALENNTDSVIIAKITE